MKKLNCIVNYFYSKMVKELLHICRTYSVTFRFIKKNELYLPLLFIYLFMFYYIFFLIF